MSGLNEPAVAGASESPSPREWVGAEPFPWPAIDELVEGARFTACYSVGSKQLALTKDEKPYLRLQLGDRSGNIEGRVWDDARAIDAAIDTGSFVGVRGRMQSFRGQPQLRIEAIRPIAVSADEYELFLPRYPGDIDRLDAELDALIATVADEPLRALLVRLLGAESETGRAFRRAPAAKRNHHAYIGGLLEHSLSVATSCAHLARHYGASIDRDLLVAGALVHDIGKIQEIGVSGGFPYTDEGKLLGHILLGLRLVEDEARNVPSLSRERLVLLLHLVASHQGRYEWQSPKIPMLLEALLLHYVDDLDAKMHQATALVESVEAGWTRYDPSFGRDFLRHRDPESAGDTEDAEDGSVRLEVEVEDTADVEPSEPAAEEEDGEEPVAVPVPGADSVERARRDAPRLSEDTLDLFPG